jgi:hypothetical protein
LTPGGNWHLRVLPTGEFYEWRLQFKRLTWSEAQNLITFYQAMQGGYHCFRFCDPLRNLLAWSEDITQTQWTNASGLNIVLLPNPIAGVAQGAHITNTGNNEGSIQQIVACTPNAQYSTALIARSAQGGTIGLLIGDQRKDATLEPSWQSVQFTATPGGAADAVSFGLVIPAGGAIDVSGIQVDYGSVQPEYKKSDGQCGVFQNARFEQESLVLSAEQPNVFSIAVTVIAHAEV